MTYGDAQIESGAEIYVNSNSITLSVGNTGTATNGNIQITAIEVIHGPADEFTTPVEPSEPGTEPSEPGTEPSEPGTEPSEPGTEPSEPSTEPSEPSTEPSEPTEPEFPAADTAYVFGMIQENKDNTVYYLAGGMNGFYMATTDDANAALKVYLEETEGGYYLYCYVEEVKTYINMVVSGTHVNGAYETTASTVYTYDSERNILVSAVIVGDESAEYTFGTRNDKTYTTVGPVKVSYNGFWCKLSATAPETPVEPSEPDVPAETWSVTGSINGSNWDKDFVLTASDEENVLVSEIIELAVGNEFKIRLNYDWDNAYPEQNYVVRVKGAYRISFNTVTHEIKLIWCGEGEEPTPEVPTENVWSAIGALAGTNWDTDFEMVASDTENVLITNRSFTLNAGDEFKIRLNGSWSGSYPGPVTNYQVETSGVYYITFNVETKEIGLVTDNAGETDPTDPSEPQPTEPAEPGNNYSFVKVTEEQEDWSGTYLIVWEGNNQIFNAALENFAANAANGATVEIVNGTIGASDEMKMCVTIEKVEGGYLVKTADGRYISRTNSTTGIDVTENRDEAGIVNIVMENGEIKMTGEGGCVFCVDIYKDKNRFVFLATKYLSDSAPIALYKLTAVAETPDVPETPADTTVNVVIADYADANGWENSTAHDKIELNDDITVAVSGTPVGTYSLNTGKYYEESRTWRTYQAESAIIVIQAAEGKTIVCVMITYAVKNDGVLTCGDAQFESGTMIIVNGNSITLGVGNTGTKANGQVQITAIEVIYN